MTFGLRPFLLTAGEAHGPLISMINSAKKLGPRGLILPVRETPTLGYHLIDEDGMRYFFSLLCLGLLLMQCQQAFSAEFPFGKLLSYDAGHITWEVTINKVEDGYETRGEVHLNDDVDFRKWRTSHLRLFLFYKDVVVDKIYIPIRKTSGRTLYFDKRFATKYYFDKIYLYSNLVVHVN